MPKHQKHFDYFEGTQDWSFATYIDSPSSLDIDLRIALWVNGLRAIIDCPNKDCCSSEKIDRAFNAAGQYFLRDRHSYKKSKQVKKRSRESSVEAVHINNPDNQRPPKVVVGIGTVSGGKVTQHFHGQNATLSALNPSKESTVSEPGNSETPQKTWSQRKILTTYVSIRTTDKWAVSRGCIVEDRIYMYCNTHPSILEGSLLEFFVLDITDPLMTAMFEVSEEQVIRNAFPPLPPPNDSARRGMQPYYNIKSLDCLRDVLSSNETCRRDATSSWIRLAHDSFYRRLCCRDNKKLFHISLLSLVYELLDTIDSIDTIVPSPSPSIENVWPELDQIIQVDDVGGTAIGAIEISHRFQPNLLGGSRALRLKLRDMLIHIHGIVGARAAHRVQTVGIIVTGRQLQIVRCWARRPGGVVLLQPSDVQEFPECFQHIVALQYMVKCVIMGTQILRDVSNVLMESQMGQREARFFEFDGVEG